MNKPTKALIRIRENMSPCPWCKSLDLGYPFLSAGRGLHYICCNNCGSQGPYWESDTEKSFSDKGEFIARSKWNRWTLTEEKAKKIINGLMEEFREQISDMSDDEVIEEAQYHGEDLTKTVGELRKILVDKYQ